MPFTFTLPQTFGEALLMFVPFVTLLLGVLYLLMPGAMLKASGLEAKYQAADAIGEGRAAFAGILLAFGLACLLLQEPKALQPGLNTMLGFAWLIAGLGFLLQIVVDGARGGFVVFKAIAALCFGGFAYISADQLGFGLVIPVTQQGWIFAAIATVTALLGLIGLIIPSAALNIMRLQENFEVRGAIGEPRGILGGFYLAAGLGVLVVSEPLAAAIWLQLLLGATWLLTAFGRIAAMIFDPAFGRGFTLYHIIGTVFEFAVGFYIVGSVFGVI